MKKYLIFTIILSLIYQAFIISCKKSEDSDLNALPDTNKTKNIVTADNLIVNFKYQGISYKIAGKQLDINTFIYNEGAEKQIWITTLDWPPYIGSSICKQGWVQQFTIAILASQGYEIKCTFYPWARTISVAEQGLADILYPEYFIENTAPSDVYKGTKRIEHLALSRKIPGGPIAFMKRKNEKINFNGNLDTLKDFRIGVVAGYQNTPEFDRRMDEGFFNISTSIDDLSNARKLIGNRIDLLIGDPAVILFNIKTADLPEDERNNMLNNIESVTPALQYNNLYYAISKKKSDWEETLNILNKTISEFENSGEMKNIINNTNLECMFQMRDTLGFYN